MKKLKHLLIGSWLLFCLLKGYAGPMIADEKEAHVASTGTDPDKNSGYCYIPWLWPW